MTELSCTMLNENDLRKLGFKSVGDNVQVSDRATFYGVENIILGSNVRIDDYCVISAGDEEVSIGSHVHIAFNCAIIGGAGFDMGDYSTISAGVKIFTVNDDYSGKSMTNPTVPDELRDVEAGKVTLGKHVIVGANSVILPSSQLGEGVAIGACSVVKGDIDEWGIYAGRPVKFLRTRDKNALELEKEISN